MMRITTPRWLLVFYIALLSGAVLLLVYKALMRVSPLPLPAVEAAAQARQTKAPDRQTQLLTNYRQYPDRYIRILEENWVYSAKSKSATHMLKLRNLALAAYSEIEISFTYESAAGKELLTRTVKIPESLAAQETKNLKGIKVPGVPEGAKTVVVAIKKATVQQE